MAQITESLIATYERAHAEGKHAPLTIGEEMQLIHAWKIANLQSAKPADALGSLPVVAIMAKGPVIYFTKPVENGLKDLPVGQYDLTPISYATAEITKRDAYIEQQRERFVRIAKALRIAGCPRSDADRVLLSFEERAIQLASENTTLRAKLESADLIVKEVKRLWPDIRYELGNKSVALGELLKN